MEEDLLTLQKKMYKVVKGLKRMEFILKMPVKAVVSRLIIYTSGISKTFRINSQSWGGTQAPELSVAPQGTPTCGHVWEPPVQVMSLQCPGRFMQSTKREARGGQLGVGGWGSPNIGFSNRRVCEIRTSNQDQEGPHQQRGDAIKEALVLRELLL